MPATMQTPVRNSLLDQTVRRSFWACAPLALTVALGSFVDTVMAGLFFSAHHLTAVGISSSVGVLITAILMIFAHGSYSSYSNALGRGQRRKCREIFSVGIIQICSVGLLLSLLIGHFAVPVTHLFGAATAALQTDAAQYLRFALFSYPLTALNYMFMLVIGIYGYRRQMLFSTLINFVTNVVFSYLFIRWLPAIGLGALGLGTICAGICSLASCSLLSLRRQLHLSSLPRLAAFRWARTKSVLISGLTTSSNMLIDGLIAAVINQIIVSSALGETGLTAFSVVSSFWRVAQVPSDAMDYAVAPLFGICYVRRDRSALKAAGKISILRGLMYNILWVLLIYTFSASLLTGYVSGEGSEAIRSVAQAGILVTLAFTPIYFVVRTLTTLYDASDSVLYSMAAAIIPDSVLFPLLLVFLLPRLGYMGIWLSYGGNTSMYLLLYYFYHVVLSRSPRVSVDCLFHLDDGICTEHPQIDVSISYDDADISRLSAEIQRFLEQENAGSRISYMTALCMDELATDIVGHSVFTGSGGETSLLDVKMISEPDDFQIIIRSTADPYNPLDFEPDGDDPSKIGIRMAQRLAKKIDYDYIYNMNMITIQIAK